MRIQICFQAAKSIRILSVPVPTVPYIVCVCRSQEEGKKREEEEGGRSRDSPLLLHSTLEDLLHLIEAGQDMRKITKVIKLLCNTEESLRWVLIDWWQYK